MSGATGPASVPGAEIGGHQGPLPGSAYWSLLALVVLVVGFGAVSCAAAASHPGTYRHGFDPTARSLFGLHVGQLVTAVFGALTRSSPAAC